MAQKSKRKQRALTLVLDEKTNTLTLNAATIVLKCEQILVQGKSGKRPIKLLDHHVHFHKDGYNKVKTSGSVDP